jgi:hypothetical protein
MGRIGYFVLLAAAAVALTCGASDAFRSPDPIELTERFGELEALARDGSPAASEALMDCCFSEDQPFQVKRFACRMLSRIATSNDLAAAPVLMREDYLWASWRLVGIRVSARESGDRGDRLTQELLSFLQDLSRQAEEAKSEGRADWPWPGMERDVAVQEIGFYVSDSALPLAAFPPEVVDRSTEIALDRLRTQYATVTEPEERAQRIGDLLGEEDAFTREAAVALLIELGEPAVSTAEVVVSKSNILPHAGSSFTAETRAYDAALEVMAGVGGERAAAVLARLAGSDVPHAAANAAAALRWVDAGVRFRPLYMRLFPHPYVDE